jgi:hypothetical protein
MYPLHFPPYSKAPTSNSVSSLSLSSSLRVFPSPSLLSMPNIFLYPRPVVCRKCLAYAGGVGCSGYLRRMFFYDAPTRSWRVLESLFGTAQVKMVEKENGQHLWVNFWESRSRKNHWLNGSWLPGLALWVEDCGMESEEK